MKLTVSTLSCPEWLLEKIIAETFAAGIAGIDFRGLGAQLDITQLPAFSADLPKTLAAMRSRGLSMPCLNTSVTLVMTDADRWKTMLEEMRRYADLARRCGTKYVRIFGGHIPANLTRDQGKAIAIEHLNELIEISKPNGCIPLLETHDDWATSEEVLSLLATFSPETAGVLWDIEHPLRKGETPEKTAAAMGRLIRHVHIKDSLSVDGHNVPKLLGEGSLPIRESLSALQKNGYQGWICLECEKRWHASAPEPEVSIPQFARFMSTAIDEK